VDLRFHLKSKFIHFQHQFWPSVMAEVESLIPSKSIPVNSYFRCVKFLTVITESIKSIDQPQSIDPVQSIDQPNL
jgi:hypothetical protein